MVSLIEKRHIEHSVFAAGETTVVSVDDALAWSKGNLTIGADDCG